MTTVLEISDSEEISDGEEISDDCVIESVIYLEDQIKEKYSDLYSEVYKVDKLLAEFIERCLRLENSKCMLQILKQQLLQHYYNADKTARESPKFQRNLKRANNLLLTYPRYRFTHIKDLCDILKALKVKKKVPFITLSTNLEAGGSCSKKAELDDNNMSPFSETISCSTNDTVDDSPDDSLLIEVSSQHNSMAEDALLDGSMCVDQSTQEGSVAEDSLLVEKKDISTEQVTYMQNRINAIENKITYYKKRIAILDEQEVDDDSVNSPYIRSERFKSKIVSLYTELCKLKGSQPVKRRGIHLKVRDGRPPGPTKVLERFLNKNLNKDGDPPFPDFCDVVNCVIEANDKDGLGWTKAQIMKEASALFTRCGRALQKRRQIREYRDLIHRVALEDLDKDPADDDPQLKARLKENKRIARKKESDILEKYTMMQNLPPKTNRSKTEIRNNQMENVNQANINSTNNPISKTLHTSKRKDQCNGNNKHNMHNSYTSNLNEDRQENQDTTSSYSNIDKLKDSVANVAENTTKSRLPKNTNKNLNNNIPYNKILLSDDFRHKNISKANNIRSQNTVDTVSQDETFKKETMPPSNQTCLDVLTKLNGNVTMSIEIID